MTKKRRAKPRREAWTKEEDKFLEENLDKMTCQEMSDKLHRPLRSTYFRRHIIRSVHESFEPYSEEELQIIKDWYKEHTTRKSLNLDELVIKLGCKRRKSSICRKANLMGLTKKWIKRKNRRRKKKREVIDYDEEE